MHFGQAGADTLAISPAAVTNGATSAVNIDTLGADSVSIRVALSNIAQATIASADGVTVKLQESDDTNSSNAVSIAGFTDRTGIKFGREVRYEVLTQTRKRYLRLSVIPGTSGVSNEPVTACVFATLNRREQAAGTSTGVAGSNDAFIIG